MNRKDYYARRRAEAKAAGICVSCLKRPATHGQKCEHCRMIQQAANSRRDRSKHEKGDGCHFCSEPCVFGKKVCPAHLEKGENDMKKIINGKKYDTTTAKLIGRIQYGQYGSLDFVWEGLFRKKTGEYFLQGEGGAMSRYSVQTGQNNWSGSKEIIPLSLEKAKEWAEKNLDGEDYEAEFGEIEEGDFVATSVRLPEGLHNELKNEAVSRGISLQALIAEKLAAGVL